MTSETPEARAPQQGMALPSPADYVITLVHGTFTTHAEWTSESSPLARKLRDELGGNVILHRFQWTGLNSYDARREAGQQLRRHFTKQVEDQRGAHHFVIAHSHGGNVALYALNDPPLAKRISGLVTLATPFLRCEPRNSRLISFLLQASVLWSIGFAVIPNVVLPLILRGLDYSHTLGGWSGTAVYGGCLLLGGFASLLVWWLSYYLTKLLVDLALKEQKYLVGMLNTTYCKDLPLFALRFRGDEAKLWLALLAIISGPAPFVFRLLSYMFMLVYIITFLMVGADIILEFVRLLSDVFVPVGPWIFIRYLYWMSLAVLVTILIIALALPKMFRAHWLGYGKEALLTPILVKITAADLPLGFTSAYVKHYGLLAALSAMRAKRGGYRFLKLRLLHSWLYQHEPAIADIIAWIKRVRE